MEQIKKYKILLTNHSLKSMRGTEVYTYFLSKELAKNHDVYVYSPTHGKVSERISEFAKIVTEPKGEFDIILFNHNNTVRDSLEAKCKIYTIHGKFVGLETPPDGLGAYVAISNEIAEHYKELNATVIPNGIDTDLYKPDNSIRSIKKLLYSSNYYNKLSNKLLLVALSLGMKYQRLGRKRAKFDLVTDLNSADIIVGVGRSAIEAMGCGKKVIVADIRKYADFGMDGFIEKTNVEVSSKNNYSGRAFKKPISFFALRKEIKNALNDNSNWERDWILENHNIANVADKYISLAEKILGAK